jgi:tetratricopeptide (TPR) repeat protein
MPAGSSSMACAWAVALLLVLPVRVAAQKDAFIDAFIAFHSALPGTYGDEGVTVTSSLDRMAAALDEWERAGRAAEAQLKARAGTTPAELALLYAEQHRWDDALAATDAAIAADPQRAPLSIFQGQLREAAGRPNGGAFETARRLDPSNPVAAYLVAARLAAAGGGDAAPGVAATLQSAPGLTRPFFRFALIDDLSAKTPIFSPAAYADGFASMMAGRFRQALAEFRAAAARDPLVIDPAGRHERVRLGIAALRDRRGAAAIEHLEAAVTTLPASSEAHRVLGVVYRAVGRVGDSIRRFETVVKLAPRDERARVALGTALAEAGRLDEAERALRDAIAALPASGSARWALADLYEKLSRGPEAVATLREAASLTIPAGKLHLYWRIAELAHGYQRDYGLVIDVLSRRVRLVPNEPHAHKDLGLAYARAGRDDDALVELLMTKLLGHEDAEMLGTIGQVHFNAGRFAEAEAPLRRAVALDPNLAQARYALGITLDRLGRREESKEQLDAFQRLQEAAFAAQRRTFEQTK